MNSYTIGTCLHNAGSEGTTSWAKYNPGMLRKPKHPVLATNTESDKWTEDAPVHSCSSDDEEPQMKNKST